MSAASGEKARLTIFPCLVDADTKNAQVLGEDEATPFKALINPASYTHKSSICYAENKAMGPGIERKYKKSQPDVIEFKEMVLDGTGVVEGTTSSVREQIELLREVAYAYNGSEHEPPVVQVAWGPLVFFAKMNQLSVEYTLFKPSGEPLRAKITLKFTAYKSNEEVFKEAAMQSPDLTHLVEIKAGDTLPNLCYKIYKNSEYYLRVAEFNQLRNFRQLSPGQILRFPPLV